MEGHGWINCVVGDSMAAFHSFSFQSVQHSLWCAVFVLLFEVFSLTPANAATTFYVATNGNDSNAGTLTLPFRTIQKCAGLMNPGDTCLIRTGTYRETVTPARTGTPGLSITFDVYNNEKVIISGANVVSGFTVHDETRNIYKAAVPSMGVGMDQVFINGVVQPEARFPDKASPGLEYPVTLLNSVNSVWPPREYFSVPNTSQVTGALLNGQPAGMWTGGLYMGTHYASYQFQKADITDSASGILTVTPLPGKWYIPPFWNAENGRGLISGVMNAINLPGEWVWQSGVLYIQMPTGPSPTIEAKARQLAFDLTGKSYINVNKLEIFAAGLMMYNGSNNTIDGAKFSYIHQRNRPVPGAAPNDSLRTDAGIYLGGRNNTIKNSIIAYSSGDCVTLIGLYHTLTNNSIHDCGYGGSGSAIGINIDPTVESGTSARGGHVISYNTLYNAPGPVVSMSRHIIYFLDTGRRHDPYYKTGLPTPYQKIMITHNEIYNGGILLLDIGCLFYTHGTDGGGTEIAYNVIHDEHQTGNMGWGVYLDVGSWNFNTHDNLLWIGREGGTRGAFHASLPGGKIVSSNVPSVDSANDSGSSFAPYEGGNRIFANNNYKYDYHNDYHNGVAGLTAADFPGGVRFAFGANLSSTPTPVDIQAQIIGGE